MDSITKNKRILILSISVILVIWKLSALYIGADIILPPPEKVLHSLFQVLSSEHFLKAIFATIIRGLSGFMISFFAGLFTGVLAGISEKFRLFISPFISIIRSTPVIAIILLALIWFHVDYVPVFVSFLMAYPIVTGNVTAGIYTVDKKLLEMADIYRIGLLKKVTEIYIPSIIPFIVSSISMSLGLIWKVVIAAEVLSQPKWGLGTSLNEAKAYLITEEVFAWTVIAILLSIITDIIFGYILKRLRVKHP